MDVIFKKNEMKIKAVYPKVRQHYNICCRIGVLCPIEIQKEISTKMYKPLK